jgi:hypothetical protein
MILVSIHCEMERVESISMRVEQRGEDWGEKRGCGVTDRVGFNGERQQRLRSSGDELQWPGGAISWGRRGGIGRRGRASYRHGESSNWAGINVDWRRGGLHCLGRDFWPEEEEDQHWRVGSCYQWGCGREEGTGSGSSSWAAGYFSYWAESFPGSISSFFSSFIFFIFLFSTSSITFAFDIQMTSNQFVKKIPKIQNNILE